MIPTWSVQAFLQLTVCDLGQVIGLSRLCFFYLLRDNITTFWGCSENSIALSAVLLCLWQVKVQVSC